MSHSSFFFLFFFFLITTSTIKATPIPIPLPNDLIDQTCKKCANQSIILSHSFCSTSLQVIPVSHSANLQGLALIAMELALENATNTISTIEKLLSGSSFDENDNESVSFCLRDCLQLYSDAVWTIVNSIGAFLLEDYETTRTWMSSAMEAASTCQGGFGEKGEVSPLTKENYNVFQLCGIALCIIHMSTPPIPS